MRYTLNKIPIKTTNGFNINDLKIDLNLPTDFKFNKFITKNIDNIKVEYSYIDDFNSKIGLSFKKSLNINITIDSKIDSPIEFIYEFKNNDALIDNICIDFKENSKADIIFKYISKDNNTHFHHLKQIVNVCENAYASITNINLINKNSTNIISSESIIKPHGKLINNLIDISGNIRIYNYDSITYECASSYLNNIYIGKNKELIDMNYRYENKDKSSLNNILTEGVLDDNSIKNFRGTIDFIKGSSNSIGRESENCILLSDKVISRSIPILLCGEENVIGSHSVSSGLIDEDKIFYLMSRGLSKKMSERLIILSRFNNILSNIKDEELYNEVINNIESRI